MKLDSTKWFVPVSVAGLLGLAGLYIITFPNQYCLYIGLGLPCFALLASGILGLVRLFKKQYLQGVLQIAATCVLSFIGLAIIGWYLMFYPYDFFADNLTIPDNITLNIPKDTIKDVPRTNFDFEIYNGMQPGMYVWDVPVGGLENGTIYLKAFEVTQGTPLSAERLKRDTSMYVHINKHFKTYQLTHGFTIYEGDWNHPYAARFELWYAPADGTPEKKLTEKIYKIEGWQR